LGQNQLYEVELSEELTEFSVFSKVPICKPLMSEHEMLLNILSWVISWDKFGSDLFMFVLPVHLDEMREHPFVNQSFWLLREEIEPALTERWGARDIVSRRLNPKVGVRLNRESLTRISGLDVDVS
jgi:hypothetical protein